MKSRRTAVYRRCSALAAFREWLNDCDLPLLITGKPFSGKTFFVRQLVDESGCVAVHYCRNGNNDSTETASVLQNIAHQLERRFPNLTLPALSNFHLLAEYSLILQHFLHIPLSTLPIPSKPMFIVIDNLQPSLHELLFALLRNVPRWLRVVVSSWSSSAVFDSFHQLNLDIFSDDIAKFVQLRLPRCRSDHVLSARENSWWFVEQLARAIEGDIVEADDIPSTSNELVDRLVSVLPRRMMIYVALVKASHRIPTMAELAAVSEIAIVDVKEVIRLELEQMLMIMQSKEVLDLWGPWADIECDLTAYHTVWAEFYKAKRRKSPQDIVELAYHCAHSDMRPLESLEALRNAGANELILRCAVFDIDTTELLVKSGATLLEQSTEAEFVYFAATGSLERVIQSLEKGVNKLLLRNGLQAAATAGHLEVCQEIIESLPKSTREECVASALRAASAANQLEIVQFLLDRGAHVNASSDEGRTALRAAAWAGHLRIVEELLDHGADIDQRDGDDRTALMAAAFMDHIDIVTSLLERSARVELCDSAGATALHLVLSNGSATKEHEQVVDLLLKNSSDATLQDAYGRSALHVAAFHGDVCLQRLLDHSTSIDVVDSMGRTPLLLAANQGKVEAVKLLVERGADIDGIDCDGRTALQLSAMHSHLNVVDHLLTLGADEAHRDNCGAVALHYAVQHGDVSLVRALASSQAIHASDKLHNEPLLLAAQCADVEVVRELIALGASTSARSLNGETPLRVAALHNNVEVVRLLCENVDDLDCCDIDETPLLHNLLINKQTAIAEILLESGASISCVDALRRAPSHVVSSTGDVCGARLLRRFGCDFSEQDADGRSPLHTAVWSAHSNVVSYLLQDVAVNPNATDHQLATPLCVAAQLGQREIVSLLLKFGADASLRDAMGRSASDAALLTGQHAIVTLLQTACGSSDSSGFGSMPASPIDAKAAQRRALRASQRSMTPKILSVRNGSVS